MPSPTDERHLTHLLGDLVQTNHRLTRVAARATGSTESPATWRTISVLQSSGPLRLGELAAHSRVSQPTMTKIVDKLAERGWVERTADAADARAWQINVTSEGVAALDSWREQLATALLPLFADLTTDEAHVLTRALDILNSRLAVDAARTNDTKVSV